MSGAFQIQCFSDGAGVRWRLLSGNNREIGRSVQVHATELDCRASLVRLRLEIPGLTHRFRPCGNRRWTWELLAGAARTPGAADIPGASNPGSTDDIGTPVAVASHSFDRLLRCTASLAVFREHVVIAPVADTTVDSTVRRWRVDPSVTRRLLEQAAAHQPATASSTAAHAEGARP